MYESIFLGGHPTAGLGDPPPVRPQPTGLPLSELGGQLLRAASREFEREIASVQGSVGETIFLGGSPIGVDGVFRYEGLRLPGLDGPSIGIDGPSNLIIATQHRLFDSDLPRDTENAVVIAVKQETDPAKLRAFAQALLPHYPVAASALTAQALGLEHSQSAQPEVGTSGFNILPKFVRKGIKGLTKDVGKVAVAMATVPGLAAIPGVGLPALLAAQVASHPAGQIAKATVGKIPVVKSVAHEVNKLSQSKPFQVAKAGFGAIEGATNPAYFGTMLMSSTGNDIVAGKRLDKVLNDVRLKGGAYLKQEGAEASLIPGIGSVLSPALTAAGALALGEPIPEAAVDIAAGVVPGGPVAKAAVKSGATFAVDLSKGQKLDVAALGAAREAAASAGAAAGVPPQVTKAAFDLGLGIAQGKNLQKAGFGMASSLIKAEGGTIAEKALGAINIGGGDLVKNALGSLQKALPAGAADMAKHAASALVQNPAIKTSMQLAQHAHVPEAVARAVLASTTREHVPGAPHKAPILQPHVLRAIVGHHTPTPALPAGHPAIDWVTHYVQQVPIELPILPAPALLAPIEQPSAAAYGPYPQVTT